MDVPLTTRFSSPGALNELFADRPCFKIYFGVNCPVSPAANPVFAEKVSTSVTDSTIKSPRGCAIVVATTSAEVLTLKEFPTLKPWAPVQLKVEILNLLKQRKRNNVNKRIYKRNE